MDTYVREVLEVALIKRARFRGLAHPEVVEGFSNLGGEIFKQIETVLDKVRPLTTMRGLSCQDGIVKVDVEVSGWRSPLHE